MLNKEERKTILLLSLLMLVCLVLYFTSGINPKEKNRSGEYERTIEKVKVVKIVNDCPNVRSEPIADDDSADGLTNSFGATDETNFTIELSMVYTTDKNLDQNGAYYGLLVEEILATPEGKTWFPSKIKKDPDGIVWVNAQYVELVD